MFPCLALAQQADRQKYQRHGDRILEVRFKWVVVDKDVSAALIDYVEQRVPSEKIDHRGGHRIRDKHFAAREHVEASINLLCGARRAREPRFDREKTNANGNSRKPSEHKH